MSVRAETSEGLYTLVASGDYDVDDLFRAFDQLAAEVRESGRSRLPGLVLDVRESTAMLRRPPEQTRRIISHFHLHRALFASRIAIVVRGHARYGLMRMATTWAALAGFHARVFWDVSAAESWVRQSLPPEPRRRA